MHLKEANVMKRIVNGVTYNTVTSTRLAQSRWEPDDNTKILGVLYQTRGGAYFVHEEATLQVWNEDDRQHERKVEDTFRPLSPTDAHDWILEGEVEVFHNPFDDPPEATAEAEPAATLYIRAPAALKQRVDEAAREAKVSGNVWAMRCVERCLQSAEGSAKQIDLIERIWGLATQFTAVDDAQLQISTARKAFGQIQGLIEDLVKQSGLGEIDKASAAQWTSCNEGLNWMTNHGPGNETALKGLRKSKS
jgi:hypothetical protein